MKTTQPLLPRLPLPLLALALSLLTAPAQPTLKDAFQHCFRIGAALNPTQFYEENTQAVALIKAQFNTITPENVLKWELVHPQPDAFDFGPADRYVAFGEKSHMFIVGHTLIWHNQTPAWVFRDNQGKALDREALLARMKDHITTVVGRYKGRIGGWDVVNEALNEDGSLRQSEWLRIIGEDYLLKAYQFAHEADPKLELYYNDFSLENAPKRAAAVALVRKLQSQGVKIAGVGLQGHYKMDWPSPSALDETIKAFTALGVKVMITELDIDLLPPATHSQAAEVAMNFELETKLNPYTNGLPEAVQQALAQRYAGLFAVLVRNQHSLSRVTFWGVTDGDSWLNNWPVRGRTSYPLLFDRRARPKPALDAVIRAAQTAVP